MTLHKSFAWMGLAVIIAKASSLVTQVLLGYFLTAADFGSYAFLVGAMTLVSGFVDSGVNKLLIKEQNNIEFYIKTAYKLSLILSLLGGAIFVTYISSQKKFHDLLGAAALMAIFFPLNSAAQIYKARLAIALDFAYISRVDIFNSIVYSIVLISAAFLGAGVFSFSISFVASYIVVFALYKRKVISRGKINTFSGKNISILNLAKKLRWLILTTFLMGIALRGDYLILGSFLDQADLGYYYFAFMLVANIGLLMAQGINNVFMPYLAKYKENLKDLSKLFFEKSIIFLFATSLISISFIFFGDYFIELVWRGKWEKASLLAALFATTLPLKMLVPVSYALLESFGKWKEKFYLISLDAVTVIFSVIIGAYYWGVTGAVIFLSIQRGIVGVVIYFYACGNVGIKKYYMNFNIHKSCFLIAVLSVFSFAVFHLEGFFAFGSWSNFYFTIKIFTFLIAYLSLLFFCVKMMPGLKTKFIGMIRN